MEIIKDFKNSLMKRQEFIVMIESEITPSKTEVIKLISEKTKKPAENVVVERIKGQFGLKKFKVEVLVYDDIESKDKYQVVTKKERKKQAEEAKKAAEEAKKAKEEAKKAAEEAKKAEETKEEVKSEESA
jgi:ribosomal protein S24E